MRLADPLVVVLGPRTVELLRTHRLPAMVYRRDVEMGALMSYFADFLHIIVVQQSMLIAS
jgi:hypothetical protein